MRFLISPFITFLCAGAAYGASSFAGANNYFAYSLPDADRHALLDGMQAAGMKVLRTWVTGHAAGQKNSNNVQVPDLEAGGIRNYNDAILNQIDQLMVDAHARGIKLLIENSLLAGDVYSAKYGPWSDLSAYIFGLEAQNEPMIFDQTLYKNNLAWICNTAQQIRNNVGDRKQLIFTGGGSAASSVQSLFFSSACPAIDVVAIHDYNDDYDSFMPSAISQAQAAGKKLIVEEWGSLSNVQKINNYKVPWLYWELISNPDPHQGEDYEIQVNGADWSTISSASLSTAGLSGAPFDFSASLAL
ncbi:glycoside hydrolase superfamily [Infundibulicybe gibba]|nr:glycoside hydrolase superfamily [Infundibulicybe gibba]